MRCECSAELSSREELASRARRSRRAIGRSGGQPAPRVLAPLPQAALGREAVTPRNVRWNPRAQALSACDLQAGPPSRTSKEGGLSISFVVTGARAFSLENWSPAPVAAERRLGSRASCSDCLLQHKIRPAPFPETVLDYLETSGLGKLADPVAGTGMFAH